MRMSKRTRTDSVTHVPLTSRRMIPILTMVVLFLSWQDSPGFLTHAQAQESQSEVELEDEIEDCFFHPVISDPSCTETTQEECFHPPKSTVETEQVVLDAATNICGVNDPSDEGEGGAEIKCKEEDENTRRKTKIFDKHWGTDQTIINMRDKLRDMRSGTSKNPHENKETAHISHAWACVYETCFVET